MNFVSLTLKRNRGRRTRANMTSFKSTPGSTDIRTHFTDVNWRENKRGGKRTSGTRPRREKNRGNKAPAVAECHGERLRERGKRDNCHKCKYIIL